MTALQSYPRITPFLWFDSNAEEAVCPAGLGVSCFPAGIIRESSFRRQSLWIRAQALFGYV